ncbi:YbjN domain-containing protein [Acaryochloris marina]|uniref:Uncharacterized protein n=1 Tax=Acaryochloris marina (strain MBIC 11017) TaxID=329726 RepID=B0C5H3_ACAM1|nr:YbjN domain-containing protein [Acaryochloris marina]ABW27549.1 hypothetical protein AM1_2541 [Acaryochloris marina MBIC11017]BDM82286.1 hypothetical protein AM10699_51500 [Acaryochloris marina MBIC10699]
MRVIEPEINLSSGLVTLRFPITDLELKEIRHQQIFNFQEVLFSTDIPTTSFQEAFITIISESKNLDGYGEDTSTNANIELELESEKWQILSLEIDGIVYPTFYFLRTQGQLQGSLIQAMMHFAVDRATQDENLSIQSKTLVSEAVSGFLSLGIDGLSDEHRLEKSLKQVLSRISHVYTHDQYQSVIEQFLKAKDIPFDREEDSYYFSVNTSECRWGVELNLLDDTEGIILYSYFQVELDEGSVDSLLRDLNSINQSLLLGNFQFSIEEHVLYYRNHLNLQVYDLEKSLDNLFQDNYDSIQSISLLIKDKYHNQIKIID